MTVDVVWGGQQHRGYSQERTCRGGDSLCCQPGADPWASPRSGGFSRLQNFLEYQFSPGVV